MRTVVFIVAVALLGAQSVALAGWLTRTWTDPEPWQLWLVVGCLFLLPLLTPLTAWLGIRAGAVRRDAGAALVGLAVLAPNVWASFALVSAGVRDDLVLLLSTGTTAVTAVALLGLSLRWGVLARLANAVAAAAAATRRAFREVAVPVLQLLVLGAVTALGLLARELSFFALIALHLAPLLLLGSAPRSRGLLSAAIGLVCLSAGAAVAVGDLTTSHSGNSIVGDPSGLVATLTLPLDLEGAVFLGLGLFKWGFGRVLLQVVRPRQP